MTTATDLNVWPMAAWKSGYSDVFRHAKAQTRDLADVQLRPVEAEPGAGRMIAFEHPPFAADYALIRTPSSEFSESVASHLLRWYVDLVEEPRTTTMAQWLSRTFTGQREVREIADEYAEHGYEGERVFVG